MAAEPDRSVEYWTRPDQMPDPLAVVVFEQWRQTYPADHPYRHGGVPHGPYLGRSR